MRKQTHVDELADAPNLQTYHNKPVQNFGIGLLQSMGYTKERGIGQHSKNALSEPLVLKSRPRGLGLGAERQTEEQKATFVIGNDVLLTESPYDGLVGMIIEIKQEEIIVVELKNSGSIVKVKKNQLKILSQSQMKAIKQKGKQEKEEKKKKRLKWVVPSIKVKVVDKSSKYYLKKVIVTELLSQRQFECLYCDEQGHKIYIRDLLQKDLQTVIPNIGGTVMVIKGKYKQQKGIVLQRQKKKQELVIQTNNQLQVVTLGEDDVSEYIEL